MPNDIELLTKFMKCGECLEIEKNRLNHFPSVGPIYPWTNECLYEYYKKDLRNKNVLSVTSGGDHILHAALAGAKEITGFDINRFCKYYSALKIAMIKTYSHSDFFRLFSQLLYYGLEFDEKNRLINNVKIYLSDEDIIFWEKYVQLTSEFKPARSLFYDGFMENNAYFISETYNILQKKLYDCNIRYVDSGIDKLDNVLDEKFDFIYLSNILGPSASLNLENTFKTLDGFKRLLNENGEVYDYCFAEEGWHFRKLPVLKGKEKEEYLGKKIPQFHVKTKKLTRGRVYKYKLKDN